MVTIDVLRQIAAGLSGLTAGLALIAVAAYVNRLIYSHLAKAVVGLSTAWAIVNGIIFLAVFMGIGGIVTYSLLWIVAQLMGGASIAVGLYALRKGMRRG